MQHLSSVQLIPLWHYRLATRNMVGSREKDAAIAYSVEPTRDTASDEGARNRSNAWWRFGGKDRTFVPSQITTSKTSLNSSQQDEIDNDNNIYGSVFSDSRAVEFYKPIEKYEGRHRFDMHAVWSDEEEKSLIRKVSSNYPGASVFNTVILMGLWQLDWRICLWACIMFFALQLDRGNINQALSDNMLSESLHSMSSCFYTREADINLFKTTLGWTLMTTTTAWPYSIALFFLQSFHLSSWARK